MQQVFDLYTTLPDGLRRQVLEPLANNVSLFRRVPGLKQLGGYVRHAHVPMPDRLDNFKMTRRLDPAAILDRDFRSRIDPAHPLSQQRATWASAQAGSLLNRMLAYDWKYTLADNDLPKVRYATDLAGIGVSFPFLDRGLTDFSLAIPPNWKLRRLKLRWFFKRSLRDFLPPEILAKKKHGFGLPFGPWVLRSKPLRALVEDALGGMAGRGIVQPRFAAELLEKRLVEAPGYYGEMIWLLMMLELWLRRRP
jgi:asparagine synthase (glutamine-hydrolysing)